MEFFICCILFIIMIVSACITCYIAEDKKIGVFTWSCIGFFLGPLGVALAFLMPKNEEKFLKIALADGSKKECPFCFEIINGKASVCCFCGRDLNDKNFFYDRALLLWNRKEKYGAVKDLIAAARLGHEKAKNILQDKNISY